MRPPQADHPAVPGIERLLEAVLDLSTARSLERVQQIVRRAARELTGADGATFVLRDGEQCFYADEDAIEPLWKGCRFPLSACISGWVMLHRQPTAIEDIYADPRIPIDAYRPTFVKSLAMMPIRTGDPLGAIGVYWARRRTVTADELRLLQGLADSTSIAIENVTLLRDLGVAKDHAEQASRLKDQFLAMISHELRTPLTPILSWASMLEEPSLTVAEHHEAAAAIQSCARHQLRQVQTLLVISQILAGTFRLRRVATGLDDAVRAALAEVAPDAAAKQLRVESSLETADASVAGDPDRLQEVAWHLLGNAVKFTPAGGTIRVSTTHTPSHARVVVEDSGEGIPTEFVPFVFDRFRQRDGTLTRVAGGMGLGLALVRQLVELHGGQVHVESRGPGLGATFSVAIPRA
jgi:two-component system CheB/CheR fusion protein